MQEQEKKIAESNTSQKIDDTDTWVEKILKFIVYFIWLIFSTVFILYFSYIMNF